MFPLNLCIHCGSSYFDPRIGNQRGQINTESLFLVIIHLKIIHLMTFTMKDLSCCNCTGNIRSEYNVENNTWYAWSVVHNTGQDKVEGMLRTTFSNAFSKMKIYEFRLRLLWCLSFRVQLTISQHWLRQWLGTSQAPSPCLNQWQLVY